MTRIPVQPLSSSNDNDQNLLDSNLTTTASTTDNKNTFIDQTVDLSSASAARRKSDKEEKPTDANRTSSWTLPPTRPSVMRVPQNGSRRMGSRQSSREIPSSNLNEEGMLSSGSTPTEETKLIDEAPLPRITEKLSK